MSNVNKPSEDVSAREGEKERDGFLSVRMNPTLSFHEQFWVAYVYDMRGEILRWRVFTHPVDASAWGRKKAAKLAPTQAREIGNPPITDLPWCVRIYTNGGGKRD